MTKNSVTTLGPLNLKVQVCTSYSYLSDHLFQNLNEPAYLDCFQSEMAQTAKAAKLSEKCLLNTISQRFYLTLN